MTKYFHWFIQLIYTIICIFLFASESLTAQSIDSVDASGNEKLESVACDEGRISVTYNSSGAAA